MAKRRAKRKSSTKRRRKSAKRGGHVPLSILERRLSKLSRIVASRKGRKSPKRKSSRRKRK